MTRQEALLHGKIPGAETGIEVRHTLCDICTPRCTAAWTCT